MKVLLSWLREFVDVREDAAEIARVMSLRGFAVEGIERLGEDAVVDFEVTGNRPDCMSVLGMAREIATAFQMPLKVGQDHSGPGAAEQTSHPGGLSAGARSAKAEDHEEKKPKKVS